MAKPFYITKDLIHVVELRIVSSLDEDVDKFTKDPSGCPIVNPGVGAIKIAQGLWQPSFNRLKHEPDMLRRRRLLPSQEETQFKRHVESRRSGSRAVKLNAG
jgi:hypothetical protein